MLARVGGWDRVLSGEYAGGTDLSGGQWQRVALARALAAIDAGAGVLVLDEPTAALDVRAEAELFDNFLTVTRGLTTILVSHRLSSVRHADRIVVLDRGRIVEDGTHADLVAAGGGYARMFALQAERFALAGGARHEDAPQPGAAPVRGVPARPPAALLAFLEVVGSVLTNLLPLAFGLMVTGVATHSEGTLVSARCWQRSRSESCRCSPRSGSRPRLRLNESVGHEFDRRVAELMAAVPTLDQLESPAFRDQAQIVRERQGALGSAYNSVVNAMRHLIMPVVTLIVAIGADPRLLWLLPASVPSLMLGRWVVRWDRHAEDEGAEPGRLTQHLVGLAVEPGSASELRVLGARDVIARRLRTAGTAWRRPHVRADVLQERGCHRLRPVLPHRRRHRADPDRPRCRRRPGAGRRRGDVGARDRTAAERRLVAALHLPDAGAGGPHRRPLPAARGCRGPAQAAEGTGTPPDQLHTGLSLRGLGFTYPGQDRRPSRRSTSTCRPAPSSRSSARTARASRRWSSSSPASTTRPRARSWWTASIWPTLSGTAWRARCAGAFQDHVHLELIASESITTGDLPALDNDERALQALDDAAASDVLVALPGGLTTQLGTSWDDGTELSGGQWQRLAIARGMMRGDPLLLVLDEPTSALDAATEHALFEGYADAARRAGRRGAVTVLVTHRFSTVAAADLVVVLADGRVSEVGGHAELMAAGGSYAQLYALQARGYA